MSRGRHRLKIAGLCVMLSTVVCAQTEAPVLARTRLRDMAWLVGDWHAAPRFPGAAGKQFAVRSHFGSVLNGTAVTLSMSTEGKDFLTGMFAYDGSQGTVVFWSVTVDPEEAASDETGTLVRGTLKGESSHLLLDSQATRPDGQAGHIQTRIDHLDADHYRWGVYVDYPGEGLQKLDEIVFTRGL